MKLLDLKTDIVFKLFFSKAENEELLIDFVTAFIKPATPIKEIKVLNPILMNDSITHKESILDLRLKLDSGEQLDVEMQMLKRPHFKKRLLYYWAKLHQGQMIKGDEYHRIQKTVSIAILNYNEFTDENDRFHHVFEIRNRLSGELLVEDLEMHLLELPKLEKVSDLGHIEKWGCFFLGKLDELEGDKMMAKAKSALMELTDDERAYHMAWDREEAERERLTRENDRIRNDLRVAEAEKRVVEGEKRIVEGEKRIVEGEKRIAEGEKGIAEGQNKLAEAEKKNAEAEKKNAEAEKKNAEAEKKNAEAEKKNAEAEKKINEKERLLNDKYYMICSGMLKSGMSVNEIAETIDLSVDTVFEILKK